MFMAIKRHFQKLYGKKNPGMKTSPNHFLFCVSIYGNSICCSGLELTQTIFFVLFREPEKYHISKSFKRCIFVKILPFQYFEDRNWSKPDYHDTINYVKAPTGECRLNIWNSTNKKVGIFLYLTSSKYGFQSLTCTLEAEYFAWFLIRKTANTTPNTFLIRPPIARKIKVLLGGQQKEENDRTGGSCSTY